MEDRDDGDAIALEVAGEVEDLDLVCDVEVGCGFVEEDDGGLLGEDQGDPDPLALSAGQFGYESVGEIRDVDSFHGLVDGLLIGGRPLPQDSLVRVPSPGYQILDDDSVGCVRGLG